MKRNNINDQSAQSSSHKLQIWLAIIGLIGILIPSYLGYLQGQSQLTVPIQLTQTSEAKVMSLTVPPLTMSPAVMSSTVSVFVSAPISSTPLPTPILPTLTPEPFINATPAISQSNTATTPNARHIGRVIQQIPMGSKEPFIIITAITDLDILVKTFRLPTESVPTRDVSLQFVAPAWDINFIFRVSRSVSLGSIKSELLRHFQFSEHAIILQEPSPLEQCEFEKSWRIALNGHVVDEQSEQATIEEMMKFENSGRIRLVMLWKPKCTGSMDVMDSSTLSRASFYKVKTLDHIDLNAVDLPTLFIYPPKSIALLF